MPQSKFVTAWNKKTGEKHRIPQRWIGHPLGDPFTTTEPRTAPAAQDSAPAGDTAAAPAAEADAPATNTSAAPTPATTKAATAAKGK